MELSVLIKECRDQRLTAQKWLFDRFALSFFLLCRRYLKSDEAAEECMMGGFLKILKSVTSFEYKNDAATIAWMKKIMVNECLQTLRKKEPFDFVGNVSIGYLVSRKGNWFEPNTFKIGIPGVRSGWLQLEPEFFFHDFLKGISPSIKLTLHYE
jgi:DNA-directed RNA polymerase specialized sigma24 family protein